MIRYKKTGLIWRGVDNMDKIPKYIKPDIESCGLDELASDWNFEIFGQLPECQAFECVPL